MRVMELLFRGGEFTEVGRAEEGGKLFRLIFEGVDLEGDYMLYDYRSVLNIDTDVVDGDIVGQRAAITAVIDVVFHDKEGTPCGGYNVADYKNGVWELPH